ncbi:hypothetical protein EYZ11_009929 [Aspergillus tanneri]|uniref:Zn(2)-C6 fungal-type domain-containing protein n=1 Tax=Aspergillus tanneri TaxID=1220188 RepID=A0A4V3UNC3_9EURO|nr:hypothetical protein EYZ11_009929 [Aspergillus tanneri]
MEIDPRLHPGGEVAAEASNHSLVPSPGTRHTNLTVSSSRTPTEYPDPPPYFSGERLRSAPSATSNVNYYNTSTAQSPVTHTLCQGKPESILDSSNQTYSSDTNDPYADLKRPRACEACRQLKVRCEPDATNPNGSCKRCAKARRSCVVTVPTRKRQKKTDSRVAELERKIDALTASLQASHGQDPLLQAAQSETPRGEYANRRWLGPTSTSPTNNVSSESPTTTLSGTKRHHSGEIKDARDDELPGSCMPSPTTENTVDHGGKQPHGGRVCSPNATLKPESRNEFVDVIDRGLVSVEVATEAFNRYTSEMADKIPMVIFPTGTTMQDVRRRKPLVLHAIVAAAVGPIQPDLHIPLVNDFYKVIADRIIVRGEKSLELMQGLLVTCNWYTPPDNFEELKFFQLSHLALTVGIDIGMYRKSTARSKPFSLIRESAAKKTPSQDPDSPEARRAWLGCYFVAVQVSTSLRRPILVRWSSYMDECVEILEKSPEALPTDKTMIHWAKLAQIIEEINMQFVGDDTAATVSFDEPKFQYTLKVFEKQLEQWRREARPEESPMLKQAECIVDLYMHEGAMHMELNDDKETTSEVYSSPTSAAHMNALIVALIKLYSLASAPETRIGQVIEPSSLKVEYYLDKVVQHYTTAGDLAGGRTPAKFSVVLRMLRSWFAKRKDQIPALKEILGGKHSIVLCQDGSENSDERNQPSKSGSTPLHLLSEVAVSEPKNRPADPGQIPYPQRAAPTASLPQTSDSLTTPSFSGLISQSQSLDPTSGPPTGPNTTSNSENWVQYPPSRQYYPSFSSPYQDIPSSGYPDPSGNNLVMSDATQEFYVPELGLQVGVDPSNLFALENMFGYGVLNLPLPLPTDDDIGYY